MKAAFLPDRGVVKVAGDDARDFLHGLFSANIHTLTDDARPRSASAMPIPVCRPWGCV
jgi:folate-binding Fe-S cluster repair protein YgfZ